MTSPDHADTLVPAQPRARVVRRVAIIVAAIIALGLALRLQVYPWFVRYLAGASRFEIAERMQDVLYVLAALLVLGALFAFWHGVRILRAGRWPLRGAFVVKDTRVRRGPAAKWRAVAFIVLGVVQAVLAAGAWALPRFIYQEVPLF